MRSWQIVGVSVIVAGIVASLFLLREAPITQPGLAAALVGYWPTIVVTWLSAYGISALALTTVSMLLEIGRARRRIMGAGFESQECLSVIAAQVLSALQIRTTTKEIVTPRQIENQWIWRLLVRLAVVQYFTSIFALLGVGQSRFPVEPLDLRFLPTPIADSTALTACGAVILVGFLGVLAVNVALAPLVRTASRLLVESPELRLLRKILQQIRGPTSLSPVAPDVQQFRALIEPGQRSIMNAIESLTIAITQLSRAAPQELTATAVTDGSRRPAENAMASPAAIEAALNELRTTVAALNAPVTRLGEWAASLASGDKTLPASPGASFDQLLQLSTELQKLLQELGGVAEGKEDGNPAY